MTLTFYDVAFLPGDVAFSAKNRVKLQYLIDAILAIYELGDPSLMAQVFADNYILNMHRYM